MQSENKKWDSSNSTINGSQWSDWKNPNVFDSAGRVVDDHGKGKHKQLQCPMQQDLVDSDKESFYKRLSKLYETWGLNLVFNARETMLDLHLFYQEVTVRGGFHHVTKYRRWDEVVFALKLEANQMKFRTQLQILYALLLYKFEQTYFYREPAKAAKEAKAPDCSAMKRKNGDNFFDLTEIEDDVEMKKMCKGITFPMFAGPRIAEPKLSPQTPSKKKETKRRLPSKKKETKRRPGGTRGLRTAYNIFLKEECARLRTVHGKSLQGQNIREMAVDAWRCLPESKRQPYIEESKKERERVVKQKAALKDQQNMQNTKTQETCLDDDYHVTLETNVEKFHVPDESTVKTNVENFLVLDESTVSLAITTMKNPIFQIDCFGSLDTPCEGSKLL